MRGLVRAYVETRRTGQAFGALPPFSAAERFFLSGLPERDGSNLAATEISTRQKRFRAFFSRAAQTWMEYLN
jgi:hypothetical protein